jgi:2-haloacid dehalogenase
MMFEFFDWFEYLVISGEVKLIKPDPRIFELLLSKIGRPADECVYIDDSTANVSAAGELGFGAIHFRSAEQLRKELAVLRVIHTEE